MTYTIKTPNEKYCGVVATVDFRMGTGTTEDETLLPIFETLGYEVIKPEVKKAATRKKAVAKSDTAGTSK